MSLLKLAVSWSAAAGNSSPFCRLPCAYITTDTVQALLPAPPAPS